MGWRDEPGRGLPEDGWCPATTVLDGLICGCAKRSGHRGAHADTDGVRWSDDLADC